jgi:hypothetical protein
VAPLVARTATATRTDILERFIFMSASRFPVTVDRRVNVVSAVFPARRRGFRGVTGPAEAEPIPRRAKG